jgi:heme-degrading monooxygenase HmoA
MYTRIVQCDVKKERISDLRKALPDQVHPILRKQTGFVDVIETLDENTGQFVCMSLWRTREDADRFGKSNDWRLIQENLVPLAATEPTLRTHAVENSTAHQIRAGKAAA